MSTCYLDPVIAIRLDEKLQRLGELRPLPKSGVEKLKSYFLLEMTYNSNSIEGNSLTLRETALVINEGITVKGKPLKDHLEAKDHHAALQYLYDFVEKDRAAPISEKVIRSLHQLATFTTDREWAGVYRNGNVLIAGAAHNPPDALDVPPEMQKLTEWLENSRQNLSVVEMAAILHHKITWIHPFFDGNGRTARLLMNLLLMQEGYPLAVILKNDRRKYYRILAQADRGNVKPFVQFVAQAVERSLDMYLKNLTPVDGERESYVPLAELARHTPYSAKYLNLLARSGKIAAHKEGRVWLSTVEAVSNYRKIRKRQV